VLRRTTSSGAMVTRCGGCPVCCMSSSSRRRLLRPISPKSWRTVVSGGVKYWASGTSSKPTTLTSRGISRPRSCSARRTPSAIWSLATKTAVASRSPASCRPTRYPEAGPADSIPVVSVDQVAGGQRATEHLLELGHPTVWHLAGPTDWVEAQQRLDGWRRTLEAAGAPIPEPLYGDWSARSGYEAGRRLATTPGVTAVFVANDQMALGVLHALHQAGIAVPGQVSVVGFDDMPEAEFFLPALTTIRQEFNELGRRGLRALVEMIDGSEVIAEIRVSPTLVVRDSSQRPPA